MVGFISEWNWFLKVVLQEWVKLVMKKNNLLNVPAKKSRLHSSFIKSFVKYLWSVCYSLGMVIRDTKEDRVAME